MATATVSSTVDQQQQPQQQQQQRPLQQQQQHTDTPTQPQPKQPQPSVEKVRSLLYRRLKVVLPSGRVIEGDLASLDKQGNLILSNACEHILNAGPGGTNSSSSSTSSNSNSSSNNPPTTQLGMVLVPKAQQQEVSLRVTLSEKASMLSLASASGS